MGRAKAGWDAGRGKLPAAGGARCGEQVTARPGCPGTGCSWLHQLPLRAWCHDLSPCADVSVCPARLSPFPIPKFMAPVSQGAWAAGALLVRVGAKSSLLLLARERCQRCQPGAPCGFVPSYWCGAAPRRCQGQRERRAGTQGGAAFLPAPPEPAFWACCGSSLSPPSLGTAAGAGTVLATGVGALGWGFHGSMSGFAMGGGGCSLQGGDGGGSALAAETSSLGWAGGASQKLGLHFLLSFHMAVAIVIPKERAWSGDIHSNTFCCN